MDKIKSFFNKVKLYFINRFSKFNVHNYIILGAVIIISALGLQFSIGMSISLSKGLTLFGDEKNHTNKMEIEGPTSSDIRVLTIFWILTTLVLAFLIFHAFFYKLPEKEVKQKEIVDKKISFVEEEQEKTNE